MHFAFAFDLSEFVDGLEEGAAAGDQRNRSGSGAGRAAAAGRGRSREAAPALANAEDEEQQPYATPTRYLAGGKITPFVRKFRSCILPPLVIGNGPSQLHLRYTYI